MAQTVPAAPQEVLGGEESGWEGEISRDGPELRAEGETYLELY